MSIDETNKMKSILAEIMLTGTCSRSVIRHSEAHACGFVIVDLSKMCWVITDKGRKWLDAHR